MPILPPQPLFTKDNRAVNREKNIFSLDHQPRLHLDTVAFSQCNKIKKGVVLRVSRERRVQKKRAWIASQKRRKEISCFLCFSSLYTSPQIRWKPGFLALTMPSPCPVTYHVPQLLNKSKQVTFALLFLTTLICQLRTWSGIGSAWRRKEIEEILWVFPNYTLVLF